METAWNTGALYTSEGQRIAARIVGDTVIFNDIDRGIWGEFPIASGASIGDKFKLRDLTMANYNVGNYSMSMRHDVLKELGQLAAGKRLAHV